MESIKRLETQIQSDQFKQSLSNFTNHLKKIDKKDSQALVNLYERNDLKNKFEAVLTDVAEAFRNIQTSFAAEKEAIASQLIQSQLTVANLEKEKALLAEKTNKQGLSGGLEEALSEADVFIGVSKGDTVKEHHIKRMAKDPIVFALANPVPEIMPEVAKRAGARVVATGRSDFANQINNSLGFPGIFRGALDHKVRKITDAMLIRAAKNLAALVQKPSPVNIIPNTFDKAVVQAVAKAIR